MKFWNREHAGDSLPAFSEGLLSPLESQRISEHLRTCKRCRRELAEVRFTGALLAEGIGPHRAPDELWSAIEDRRQEQTSRASVARRPGLAGLRLAKAGALAFFTVAVAAAWLWRLAPSASTGSELDLSGYLLAVQGAPVEQSLPVISAAAQRFVDEDQRQALGVAGLDFPQAAASPLSGYEILAHRVCSLDGEKCAQLVYAKGRDAFSIFVAPRDVRFGFGNLSASEYEVRGGVRCQKLNCPRQQTYLFGEGDFHCVLVSKSFEAGDAAAVMRYFAAAHRR